VRRSRLDQRERALSAEQGRDSAEVNTRLKQCFGSVSTEGKPASCGIHPRLGSSRRTKNGQRKTHVLNITLFSNPGGRAVASYVRRGSAVPLRPNALRVFLIKQAANETPKHAKDGRKHLSSVFPFHIFQHITSFVKTAQLYKGKNNIVTTHNASNAKVTNLRSQIRSGHAANTSGGEFRSPVLQVFAPARSRT
jgi:hypothetical protein